MLLRNRGPDVANQRTFKVFKWNVVLSGYTLWLQGDAPTQQPLVDESGSMLLWNGDAFYTKVSNQTISEKMSDSQFLLEQLEICTSVEEICSILESVQGPWSIVYYKKSLNQIITGRDKLGRHSLLWNVIEHGKYDGSLVISSVASSKNYQEIEASHIYTVAFNRDILSIHPCYSRQNYIINKEISPTIAEEYSSSNLPEKILSDYLYAYENKLKTFNDLLMSAIKTRVECQPRLCKNCLKEYLKGEKIEPCRHAKLAVLFSGGLDSTILAALSDAVWPLDEPIDLLNVAFPTRTANHGNDIYSVPDRITGRQALKELEKLNPERKWNFVQVLC